MLKKVFDELWGKSFSLWYLGLCGKLNPSLEDGLAGEYPSMDETDLQAIDREGRAIMTEHELE